MSKFPTVAALEAHLATRSYITGYSLSKDDKSELTALAGIPSADAFPNAYRWAIHIVALGGLPCIAGVTGGVKAAPAPKKAVAGRCPN
jgi:hypothetical protein